jgi:protein-S-isoprenylcysteine O-methyltransferase
MSLSTLWLAMMWGWLASEVFLVIKTRTVRSSGGVQDRGSMFVLWLAIASSVTAAQWIGEVSAPTMPGGHALKIAGIALMALGLSIRWIAILELGKAFSVNVAVREGQTLLSTGLYRVVRHPSYLGLILIFGAVGVHSRNWLALAIVLLPTIAALIYRMHVEEAALRRAFGEQYITYSRTTRRLIPGIY